MTNNLGVALVTTARAGRTPSPGVAGAWLDSTPCLFISGQVKRADMIGDIGRAPDGRPGDRHRLHRRSRSPSTRSRSWSPRRSAIHLEKAVYLARRAAPARSGSTSPWTSRQRRSTPRALPGFEPPRRGSVVPARPELADAGRTGRSSCSIDAERPVILAGNGVRLAGAQEDFLTAGRPPGRSRPDDPARRRPHSRRPSHSASACPAPSRRAAPTSPSRTPTAC